MKEFSEKIEKKEMNKMNVKPKNLNVMKRNLFKLMMLIGLIALANTTFAADGDNTHPYQGGTYTYTVSNISVTSAPGEATISFSGFSTTPVVSDTSFTWDTDHYVVPTGTNSFTFDLTYADNETVDTGNTITVSVQEGGSGCTNYITLTVEIIAAPTMDIAIATASGGCQAANSTPPTDGSADAYTGGSNTATFVVTAGTSPTGYASMSYVLGVSGVTLTTDPSGTKSAAGSFNAIFDTAEGGTRTVSGGISSATFTVDAAHGGGTYSMNVTTSSDDAVYTPLPTIGTFQ